MRGEASDICAFLATEVASERAYMISSERRKLALEVL